TDQKKHTREHKRHNAFVPLVFFCFLWSRLQSEIGACSNRTFAVRITATGVPLSNVGSYCHCFTQAIAASIRSGWPDMTGISSTVPCSVRVASRMTMPLTRALDASVG